MLSDIDHAVGDAYGTRRDPDDQFSEWARRVSFLIDPERRIRRIYVVRDVTTHPQEALDDLMSLK